MSTVVTNVLLAGTVVPFRVVVLLLVSVVNEPAAAVVPPIVVPLIVPETICTLLNGSCSMALFNSARVIFFSSKADWSKIKKVSSLAVALPVMLGKLVGLTFVRSSRAIGTPPALEPLCTTKVSLVVSTVVSPSSPVKVAVSAVVPLRSCTAVVMFLPFKSNQLG